MPSRDLETGEWVGGVVNRAAKDVEIEGEIEGERGLRRGLSKSTTRVGEMQRRGGVDLVVKL